MEEDMADRAAVLAWVKEKYTPGQPIFVAPVAQEFFSGDLIAAKEFMEGLVGNGLVQVPRGAVSLFELPDSTPPPSAPSSDDEEYTLEQARASWAAIAEHRTARGLGALRSDPRAFISAFGTTARTIGQAMEARSIKSHGFRQLVIQHAPAVAAHADTLSQEVAGQGGDKQKTIEVVFPALLKDRAEKLNPVVLAQFSQAGLSTAGAIVLAIDAQDGIVRLALETAGLVSDDELGDAITKFQQQGMSWMQICAEIALLLSEKKRKAEAAVPVTPPGNGHHPQRKNLYPIFQAAFTGLWKGLKALDVEGVLQGAGVNSFNDLQTMVQGTNNDLEEALDGLSLANTGLGQYITETYPWLLAYNQGLVNSRDARLVDVRHAWQEIRAFPEFERWGVSFPGQLVDQFCSLLKSIQDDLAAALAFHTADPRLQRLLAAHLLSFQMHSREMMTGEDKIQHTRRPLPPPPPPPSPPSPPPPPPAAEEGRRSPVPTLTQRPHVQRGLPQNWEQLKERLEAQGINFETEADLVAAVKENRGVVGWVLNKQRPADKQNKLSGGFVAMVRRYLDAHGVETATRNKPLGAGGRHRPSKPSVGSAPSTPLAAPSRSHHKKGGPQAKALASPPPPAVPVPAVVPAAPVVAGDGLAQGMLAMLAAASAGQATVAVSEEVGAAARATILMSPLAMQAEQVAQLPLAQVVRRAQEMIAADPTVARHIQSQPELQAILEANRQIMAALDRLAAKAG